MSKTWMARLLKLVLLVCACGVVMTAANLLPVYLSHVEAVRPDLAGWMIWIIAYGWVLAIPVLFSLWLLWRVMDTLGKGEPFCMANAARFKRIWQMAAFDWLMVAAMGVFLWCNGARPGFLVMVISGLLFTGFAVAVVCFVMSELVRQAARMREENEMTI